RRLLGSNGRREKHAQDQELSRWGVWGGHVCDLRSNVLVELIWNDPSTALSACSDFSFRGPRWSRVASGQAASSTVDHSDIRGSSARLAVMVVIRRELPRTSSASPGQGRVA